MDWLTNDELKETWKKTVMHCTALYSFEMTEENQENTQRTARMAGVMAKI
jgi:hypothetical protein